MCLSCAYNIGKKLQYIRLMTDRVPVYGDGDMIAKALAVLLSTLERHDYSKETQDELRVFIDEIENNYGDKENDAMLSKKDSDELKYVVELWHDRIWNELTNTPVFVALRNGNLNYQKLFEGAMKFFLAEIWDKLEDIEKDDLDESTRCLLTQSWTAAGVMSVRALESGIRTFYSKNYSNYHDKMSFGQILGELKKSTQNDQKFA